MKKKTKILKLPFKSPYYKILCKSSFMLSILLPIISNSHQEANYNECQNSLTKPTGPINDILTAVIYDEAEHLNRLLNEGIDVNTKLIVLPKWTPLMIAVMNRNKSVTQVLLNRTDLNINAQDRVGRTALIWAAINNDADIITMIVNSYNHQFKSQSQGVNLSTYKKNKTALHIVSNFGSKKTVQTLLSVDKININAQDSNDMTPLMLANFNKDPGVAQSLLERSNLTINAESLLGRTALMIAVQYRRNDIFKMLIANKNIDVNRVDEFGKNTMRRALENWNPYVINELLKRRDIELSKEETSILIEMMRATSEGVVH